MTAALFGLLGVIVGGVLSGTLDWWREQRAREAAAKVASRLIDDELARAVAAIQVALKRKTNEATAADLRASVARDLLEDQAWVSHRETLALALSADDWRAAANAYMAISFLLSSENDEDELVVLNLEHAQPQVEAAWEAILPDPD